MSIPTLIYYDELKSKFKKNIMKKLLTFIFILSIFLFTKIFAQNEQITHSHGTSNVTIALDNKLLQIELEAPLSDIVGFEGKPKTELQKQLLKNASDTLKNWANVFKFKDGSCAKDKVTILGENKKNHTHNHKDHHNKDNSVHSDIKILYEFNCMNPNNFKSIEIRLFELFPNIKKINTRWTTINGQGQKDLNIKQNKLTIR